MKAKALVHFAIFFLTFTLLATPSYAEKTDCSCPPISCGPCQKKVTVGKIVKFCDWGDVNVCRKIVCENVPFYFACLSKNSKKKKGGEVVKGDKIDLLYDEPKQTKKKKRSVASKRRKLEKMSLETAGRLPAENTSRVIEPVEAPNIVVAKVVGRQKGLTSLHRGQNMNLKAKQPLFVDDEIINPKNKPLSVDIEFPTGKAKLVLSPKSKVVIEDPNSILGRFQPFFYLVYGGVAVQSEMQDGSFDLLAGQLLSRSKKANYAINYAMDDEGLKVKVHNTEGELSVLKAGDLAGRSYDLKANQYMSWVSETPGYLFSQDEKQALASEGYLTPIFEDLSKKRSKKPITAKSLFASKKTQASRKVASLKDGDALCQAPNAKYNQCAWSCEGNGKKAKACEAQKAGVSCVRRVCNAAGQWGLPTPFSSAYGDLCPASGVRVGDCTP